MNDFFNIALEFDHQRVEDVITTAVRQGKKGYVCVVEGNIVTVAHQDARYRQTVNQSLVNLCDGSSLALLYNLLNKKKERPYIGGDLFLKLLGMKKYRHMFLGTTKPVLDALKSRLQTIDSSIVAENFMPLPFLPVEDFDYTGIARVVNAQSPDFIWVSLGAPKQEIFMDLLLPYLNRGIMVGIGAVFNFQSGIPSLKRAPYVIRKMKLEWLYRLIREPKKQWSKLSSFLKAFPALLLAEMKKPGR